MAETAAATARRPVHVALFDSTTLVGKGVKEQLATRSFPIASLKMFRSGHDSESLLSEFRGEAMLVTEPDPQALGPLDVAFFCGTREQGARYLDWPRQKGFDAVDLTGASAAVRSVPVVNVGVNPEAIASGHRVIAAPHPISQMLSTLLAPIVRGPGLVEAAAVVLQPASEAGGEGIEELYKQTIALLNFQDLPQEIFGRQLAFNLIPAFLRAETQVPGDARPADLVDEVLKVTSGTYELTIEVVLAPVFHCHTVLAHVRLPEGATRDTLLACFGASEEISMGGGALTPTEWAGKPGLALAGARPAGGRSAFWLWAVNDNLQSGTARNAVRIAEALLDGGLSVRKTRKT